MMVESTENGSLKVAILEIEGMTCSSCSSTVEVALSRSHGVLQANVSLAVNRATVCFDPSKTSVDMMVETIEMNGFGATLMELTDKTEEPNDRKQTESRIDVCSPDSMDGGNLGEVKVILFVVEDSAASHTGMAENMFEGSNPLHSRLQAYGKKQTGMPPSSSGPSSPSIMTNVQRVIHDSTTEPMSNNRRVVRWQDIVADSLKNIDGVYTVDVRVDKEIRITFDDGRTGPRVLDKALRDLGLLCCVPLSGGFMMAQQLLRQQERDTRRHFMSFVIAISLTVPLILISMVLPLYPVTKNALSAMLLPGLDITTLVLVVLSTPVQFFCGYKFHAKAYTSVKSGSLGMDFLISSGSMAAYTFSFGGFIHGLISGETQLNYVKYFETSSVLITVVILGKYLEIYARGFTASALHSLSSSRPQTARLLVTEKDQSLRTANDDKYSDATEPADSINIGVENLSNDSSDNSSADSAGPLHSPSNFTEIPDKQTLFSDSFYSSQSRTDVIDAALVHRGDRLRLLEGDTVAADGIVESSIEVNESVITGESLPVLKTAGSAVYGGTVVSEGSTIMTVTACGDDSTLGKIVATVQEAQSSKPPIQEFADSVARVFVPVIMIVSVLTFFTWLVSWLAGAVPHQWYGGSSTDISSDISSFLLFDFLFFLSVWVSACPCAFGLATPTAIMVSTGVAAKLGVLVRKGAALQNAAEVDAVAFDKTGTLTYGNTSVSDFALVQYSAIASSIDHPGGESFASGIEMTHCFRNGRACKNRSSGTHRGESPDDEKRRRINFEAFQLLILKLIFSAETQSTHPVAKGLTKFCEAQLDNMMSRRDGANSALVEGTLKVFSGQGVKFTVNISDLSLSFGDPSLFRVLLHSLTGIAGTHEAASELDIFIGNAEFMGLNAVAVPYSSVDFATGLKSGGKIALFVGLAGRVVAVFGVSDTVRPEAVYVIQQLQNSGKECYMITGDERLTAESIGAVIGIPSHRIYSGSTPLMKDAIISALQSNGKRVAFVGDGTNDAPALARSSLGVAMHTGTSIAISAGDIVLCKNDLCLLLYALELAQGTMQRIKLNYFWALIYNAVLIPIAAGVFFPAYKVKLAPMFSGSAMSLSSISIVLSSLLLLLFKPSHLRPSSSAYSPPVGDDDISPCAPVGDNMLRPSNADNAEVEEGRANSGRKKRCNCPVSVALVSNKETATEGGRNHVKGVKVEDVLGLLVVPLSTSPASPATASIADGSGLRIGRESLTVGDAMVSSRNPLLSMDDDRTSGCQCGGFNCRCSPSCNCNNSASA